MSLVLDPIYIVNLALAITIVVVGYLSYSRTKNKLSLCIAIGFLGFAISHLAFILGYKDLTENYLIIVRILAYMVILFGLYLTWRPAKA